MPKGKSKLLRIPMRVRAWRKATMAERREITHRRIERRRRVL